MQRVLSRREFLKAAALTGGAAALAACVAPQTPDATSEEGEVAAAPVEIQWWSFPLGLPSDIPFHMARGSKTGPMPIWMRIPMLPSPIRRWDGIRS